VTGRGRPTTGVKIQIRIPADHIELLDLAAEFEGISRAELIRRIVAERLTADLGYRS